MTALALTVAAIVLGEMLQDTDGFFRPEAIRYLTLALGLLLVAGAGVGYILPRRLVSPLAVRLALIAGLAHHFYGLLVTSPGMYLQLAGPEALAPFRGGVGIAAVLAGATALPNQRLSRLIFPAVLATHFLLGVWLIRTSPNPYVDLYPFHKTAVAALTHGQDPFAVDPPNIYGENANYGPGMVVNGRLQFGFDYPPLVLLLAAPGEWLAGDFRYGYLAAMTVAGGLMAYTGGSLGMLAATLYLFAPRVFFVLEQGWTEPASVLLLALTVCLACRRSPLASRLAAVAFGLFLVSKQHFVLALPLGWLLLPRPLPGRHEMLRWLAWVLASAAAITLPFLAWDPVAFWRSVVLVHLGMPSRPEALTYSSWLVSAGRDRLPTAVGFVAFAACAALRLWRAARTPAGFAASVALCYAAFFAFGRQAFANYYFFIVGALCCAVAAAGAATPAGGPTTGPEQAPTSRSHTEQDDECGDDDRTRAGRQRAHDSLGVLTQREREVAVLVARGLSNREIAAELVITERTAETHVAHILRKLGLRSRIEVAQRLEPVDRHTHAPNGRR